MAGYGKGGGKFDPRQCNDLSASAEPKGGKMAPKSKGGKSTKPAASKAKGGY